MIQCAIILFLSSFTYFYDLKGNVFVNYFNSYYTPSPIFIIVIIVIIILIIIIITIIIIIIIIIIIMVINMFIIIAITNSGR